MKVKDCMCHEVQYVNPNASITDVAKLMLEKHIGCVPVCDTNKKLVGLVTDRDLILRSLASEKDIYHTPVSQVMTKHIYKTIPDAETSDVSKIMYDNQIRRVPVVDNNSLVGIITIGDLTNNKSINNEEVSETYEGICRCGQDAKNDQ